MAETETIFQHWLAAQFVLPFILIFFLVFAILQKTKLLGDGKKQIDALVSFVIALIFVSAVSPKLLVNDLILFLTIAIVVIFVGMLLFGFAYGGEVKFSENKYLKWVAGIVILVALVIVILLSTESWDRVINFLFNSSRSGAIWTNVLLIAAIVVAMAIALKK